jgi:hypothetical protein
VQQFIDVGGDEGQRPLDPFCRRSACCCWPARSVYLIFHASRVLHWSSCPADAMMPALSSEGHVPMGASLALPARTTVSGGRRPARLVTSARE